ncbi:2OG-Fe dioxygenase family protein [Prodigiosinella confusarubida]|nr:2OG-Fe dioxygenase family protein [Serratia sp. ATCC 39006]
MENNYLSTQMYSFRKNYYLHINNLYQSICKNITEGNKKQFINTWDNLTIDDYLQEKTLRERRICKFEIDTGGYLIPLNDCRFYQSGEVNVLLGGIERVYQRSETNFINSQLLSHLIHHHIRLLKQVCSACRWLITCHQFRILCDHDNIGLATPEGIHSDGHDYVFQHIINRNNVSGGESEIYSSEGELILRHTLEHFLETLLIDDRAIKHNVTPLFPGNDVGNPGWRDMLIIDFDKMQ